MRVQKTLYQKTYEIQIGSQEIVVDLKSCDSQFDWLEVSLVCSGSNSLLGIAKAIALRQFLITFIIQYFKSFLSKKIILVMSLTKEFASIYEIA